jgi:hypothetical protein
MRTRPVRVLLPATARAERRVRELRFRLPARLKAREAPEEHNSLISLILPSARVLQSAGREILARTRRETMKVLKWVGIIVLLVIVLFVVIGLLLPSEFNVQRSVVINAEPEKIHLLVGDLERWPEWEPWRDEDPSMETTIHGASTGVGAKQTWTGDSGSGELKFQRSDPQTGIAYGMYFNEGEFASIGKMVYEPVDGGTKVTWNWTGKLGRNPFNRYFGAMMDSMIGPMFQRGLDKLKTQVEAMPDPVEEMPEGEGEMAEEGEAAQAS